MKTCYVLACGPSIKEQDLTYLRNKPCITISNFFVHPEFINMDIKYHIFGRLHEPITTEMGIAWFTEAQNRMSSGQKVMVHSGDRGIVESNSLFTNQEVIYWSEGGVFPETIPERVDNYVSISQVALQVGIKVALDEEFDDVIILGIDHSWVNHVNVSKHFYEEDESVLTRLGYNEWFNVHNKEQGEAMERTNLVRLSGAYDNYRNIANNLGVNVFNGTPNSLITSLPKKDIVPTKK